MRVLEDCQISGKELAWASNRAKQIACSEMENMENIGMGAANCEISWAGGERRCTVRSGHFETLSLIELLTLIELSEAKNGGRVDGLKSGEEREWVLNYDETEGRRRSSEQSVD